MVELNENNLPEELAGWCASFPVQWRCELNWSEGQTQEQAWYLLFKFLKALESELGTKDFCWVAYPEGIQADGSPFQVFVGGLKKAGPRLQFKWEQRWENEAGGRGGAMIWDFDPREVKTYTLYPVKKMAYSVRVQTPLWAVSEVLSAESAD